MNDPLQPGAAPHGGADFDKIAIAVAVENEAWLAQGLGDLEGLVGRCIRAAARRAGLPPAVATEFGATFSGDAEVKRLNAEWRGKDSATNVLSFPMRDLKPGDIPGPLLGDAVFALETLLREAGSEGKTLHDHLCHLVVHGFMHCLGFDHEDAADAEAMERLETLILADLAIPDPYRAMPETVGMGAANRSTR